MAFADWIRSHRRAVRRIEILALPVLLAVAAYLWTAPLRTRNTLKQASLPQLLAAAKKNPDDPHVFYYLGLRQRDLRRDVAAYEAFKQAATLDRNDEKAWIAWAWAAGKLGNDQEAIEIARTFVKDHPASAAHFASAHLPPDKVAEGPATASLLRKADDLRNLKQYVEAERGYLDVLKQNPKSVLAFQGLGLALDAQGDKTRAFKTLNHAVTLEPMLPTARYTLARLYYDSGFRDEATRRLEMLIKDVPDDAQYLHALGFCYIDNASRFREAAEVLKRAAALSPNAVYMRDLAKAEKNLNQYDAAEAHLRQALTMAPDDAETMGLLGEFLLDHKPSPARQEEAFHLLQQAVKLQPNNTTALVALGRIEQDHGDIKQAVAHLEQAVALAPGFANGWYHLARAQTRAGNRERAEFARAAFQDVSKYSIDLYNAQEQARNVKGDPGIRLKLARLYARGSQYDKAINQYNVCLYLDPKNAAARKELKDLTAQLKASGRMPSSDALNSLLLASVKNH